MNSSMGTAFPIGGGEVQVQPDSTNAGSRTCFLAAGAAVALQRIEICLCGLEPATNLLRLMRLE
jgi:hypothetical protein